MTAEIKGPVVSINELTISYSSELGTVYALDGCSLAIQPGERIGIVGESGSGKSTLALALGRILPRTAEIVADQLEVAGADLLRLDSAALRPLRRDRLGYVFQDPMASLDPTMRIGRQFRYQLRDVDRWEVDELLDMVELVDHARVLDSFPHQLSGGMAQRVAIALAVARSPLVIVADEPTASLDAVVRKRILELLSGLPDLIGAAVLLLTHDLGAVRHFCDRVAVMYGGRIVESTSSADFFADPVHPYSRALLAAAPGANLTEDRQLEPIPGVPAVLRQAGGGCAFAPRCAFVVAECSSRRPLERHVRSSLVACHEADKMAAAVSR
jgi:peptide/nickel transport system ATP-binding protein